MKEGLHRPSHQEIQGYIALIQEELAQEQKDWDAERERIAALRAEMVHDPESTRAITEKSLAEIEEVGRKWYEGRKKYLLGRIKKLQSKLN